VATKFGSGQQRLGQCVHAGFSVRDVKKPSLTIKESRLATEQAIAVPAHIANVTAGLRHKKTRASPGSVIHGAKAPARFSLAATAKPLAAAGWPGPTWPWPLAR